MAAMTIVGITGHTNVSRDTEELVHRELDRLLGQLPDQLTGVTCLARGADQVFADVVLARGGDLEVIVPSEDYFDAITDPATRARCDDLLARAVSVRNLPYAKAGREAYQAASEELVDRCETLIAVWDGGDSSGTAGAVTYARARGRKVIVVWPAGASRTMPQASDSASEA
jgi:hypothetical protein